MTERPYPDLFSPGRIGSMTTRNRIIMSPLATNFVGEGGVVTQRLIDYYAERARGGTGLIIIENANVDYPVGANGLRQLRIDRDSFIPGLSTLVQEVRDWGARVALQINHAGAATSTARTNGIQPVAPSPVPGLVNGEIPRELSASEFPEIARKFADAARRAVRAGFDAVEIHGGHTYLLAEFLSPHFNRRTDEYGGSVENRLRFPLMVVRAVREAVGPAYPISFRLSADEFLEGGRGIGETCLIARALEEASVNLLDLSAGTNFSLEPQIEPMSYRPGWRVHLAQEVKGHVRIPVSTGGVIREPELAQKVIASGQADFVNLGRGLIADPDWANKAASGRARDIRRCIACNIGCVGNRIFGARPIGCTVNPLVGREGESRVPPMPGQGRRVVVVGGGPAGLEAAAQAGRRGCRVVLLEAGDSPGGQARLASALLHKETIGSLVRQLEEDARSAGVEVSLGHRATPEILSEMAPEVIILATGSSPLIPPIPGIDGPNVVTAHQILRERTPLGGRRVLVAGGGLVGCETAEYLASQGNEVTVAEMRSEVALDADPISRKDLVKRLSESGVKLLTGRRIVEIKPGSVLVDGPEGTEEVPADLVILALGVVPQRELEAGLPAASRVLLIGDCVAPGRIIDAMRQGYKAGREC